MGLLKASIKIWHAVLLPLSQQQLAQILTYRTQWPLLMALWFTISLAIVAAIWIPKVGWEGRVTLFKHAAIEQIAEAPEQNNDAIAAVQILEWPAVFAAYSLYAQESNNEGVKRGHQLLYDITWGEGFVYMWQKYRLLFLLSCLAVILSYLFRTFIISAFGDTVTSVDTWWKFTLIDLAILLVVLLPVFAIENIRDSMQLLQQASDTRLVPQNFYAESMTVMAWLFGLYGSVLEVNLIQKMFNQEWDKSIAIFIGSNLAMILVGWGLMTGIRALI